MAILINTGLEAGVLHAEKPSRFNGFEMICKPLKRLRSRKTPEAPGCSPVLIIVDCSSGRPQLLSIS